MKLSSFFVMKELTDTSDRVSYKDVFFKKNVLQVLLVFFIWFSILIQFSLWGLESTFLMYSIAN